MLKIKELKLSEDIISDELRAGYIYEGVHRDDQEPSLLIVCGKESLRICKNGTIITESTEFYTKQFKKIKDVTKRVRITID